MKIVATLFFLALGLIGASAATPSLRFAKRNSPNGCADGAPSQAAEALEMGADAVLVNTAIAIAADPVRMAQAFKKAIEAGREAREIGLAERSSFANATSPLTGFFNKV